MFEKLVKNTCYSKGYGFKSGLKIKSSKNTSSILRTVEKILEEKLEPLPEVKTASKDLSQFMENIIRVNEGLNEVS